MAEPDSHEPPWLMIAAVLLVVGVVAATALQFAEVPPRPAPAQLVQRPEVDLGNWEPFAPTAQEGVADAVEQAILAVE